MSENNSSKLSVVVAFFAGGFIGAGLTLLLSPSSGKETRDKIKDASTKARDKAVEKTTEAKHKVDEFVEKGREKITEAQADVQAAVEAGKKAYQQRRTELLEEAKEHNE